MTLKPVTKLDKRNKTKSKKIDDKVMFKNCDVIVIFLIYRVAQKNVPIFLWKKPLQK